ncbi:hypothetical protein GPP02_004832 [Salmonella enterica]|nr:hypothetical protein [Salmonella enterica]EBM6972684.1 hypothetical protein [Salmonella enterica]ECJ1337636.1 hypothetical protein [Salmonella enterica]EDY5786688.1 hypothetical protein [Salmonella enterica]
MKSSLNLKLNVEIQNRKYLLLLLCNISAGRCG